MTMENPAEDGFSSQRNRFPGLLPAPTAGAQLLRPEVVVPGAAAHVGHVVHGRGTAQNPAAGQGHLATLQAAPGWEMGGLNKGYTKSWMVDFMENANRKWI